MSYQSVNFILFSAVAVMLYYLLGKRLQLVVLAAANLTFYIVAGKEYLPYLLITTAVTYLAGLIMSAIYGRADKRIAECTEMAEKKVLRTSAKKKAKWALLLSLMVAIALLAVCKYTTFFFDNVNAVLLSQGKLPVSGFDMVLPIGISFYTFMALSYVLDIYWKRYKAEKNPLRYAVFLSYFPHVVQGPIDRYNEFCEQTKGGVDFKFENLSEGAQLVIWGFFKKLVIADRLGIFVGAIVDKYQAFTGPWIALSMVLYSIQIYTDFSGCIDIVTGVSEMFGIKLRKNFNHPYFSKTMGEFWRRWHMSLQEWFKDYIYYPVSASAFVKKIKKFYKNKNKKRAEELFASCFPVLVVWLITGIWHGAAWIYVVWGIYHAILLIGSQLLEPLFKKITALLHIDTENFGWGFWQMIRTFILCCIGRVFFRASSIDAAFEMFSIMFKEFKISDLFSEATVDAIGFGAENMVISLIAIFVLWVVDMMQEKMSIRKTLAKQNLLFRWFIIIVGILAVVVFGAYGPGYNASGFIYEQF